MSTPTAPAPPVPDHVDLRDAPIPLSLFISMAVAEFGMPAQEAETLILGYVLEEIGHG